MPAGMRRAWIALGGNLGDRESMFAEALKRLAEASGLDIVRGSAIYETPPFGPPGQDRYWNAVIEVRTSLEPPELLGLCLDVENGLGRSREIRWGPRTIDLDLLLFDDLVWETEELILPHPRMTERAFVLRPLADLIPEKRLGNLSVREHLLAVSEEGIERVRDSVLACR
ncbi:2-amino-4-hydroxy-6-hydroxymethyldihydropteridine diphosphokinase [Puniceicoccus vermicola]|uniref:2-amino-4-hydroxy-6-hydroxymethyldihydropteridine pyrophosphokinase n=2 Tax=Puniceicoccus vermicola TaxID=388746 RepID=A0A7X1AZ05_9BACT|nr:2-amino-4-hydroxy-6-hydroxymethyldihydropteridine diphosphokinase [Puniceicoccus vermicola]